MRSISQILRIPPCEHYADRLPREAFGSLADTVRRTGLPVNEADAWEGLSHVRGEYEPLVAAMADYFLIHVPEWVPESRIAQPLEAARVKVR